MNNNSALKIGYWASIMAVIAFVTYTICYVAILALNPIFLWTNFENYVNTVLTTNQIFKHIAMCFMILYGVCFVIQLCSIEELVKPTKKYYIKIAKLFGLGFLILISINYFVQISSVRMLINNGQTNGLEQFILSNPISAIAAINMLGWTLFFGMSCIFVSLAFDKDKRSKIVKYAYLANGVIMLIGLVGYLINSAIVVFFCMNIGMGVAIPVATIPLSKLFRDKQQNYN
ncbi:hypothetical protein PV797_16810 [Clostridiaceae bacterium M8S5]|nr:hypothetical protein PV797_16810 [Clostridiaceae bacterium M8S5]